MKALARCKDPGWWEQRGTSFLLTVLAYVVAIALAMLGHAIYEALPPFDWEEILTIVFGVFFFFVNWYLVDGTLWR